MGNPSKILGPDGKPFREAAPRSGWATGRDIASRYDAAVTNVENERHWTQADGLSAKESNSPEVRRVLRNRARMERDNNTYCSGMAETLANDTIGTGPRLQLRTSDRKLNRRVADAFEEWTAAVGLAEKLRTFRESRTIDGEGFLLLTTNPAIPTEVKLDLRGVECDQIATPDLWFDDPMAVDGIKFDRHGNPREYHLLRRHPGDLGSFGNAWGEYDAIPADLVLHWFKRRRAGQVRGVPEVTSALPLYALLRRYTLATVTAAEMAALFAVLLKTTMPPDGDEPAVAPFDTRDLVRGMITAMPEGYEAQQMKPDHPATTYDMFEAALIRQIARCLNMPFNVAAGNSAGYNYASGRLDHQVYHRAIGVDRYFLETHILDPIFRKWLAEDRLVARSAAAGLEPNRLPKHRWDWDGFKHVDPGKEAKAQEVRLANGTTTLEIECAEDGNDWRDVADQRDEERRYHAELGTPYPGDRDAVAPPSAPARQDDTEDEVAEAIMSMQRIRASAGANPTAPADVNAATGPSSLAMVAAPVEIAAARGEGKRPTFSILGYTGVPMDVVGFFSPVIVDLSGLKSPGQVIPALRNHDDDRIVGQTDSIAIGQDVRLSGTITGENDDAAEVVSQSKNGFRWQASIGATITRREFLEAGKAATVNGRDVVGPMVIAREATLYEISFVALGADGQTSADVAASIPPGSQSHQGTAMNFDQWLQAKGFDPAALSDPQKSSLRAMFDGEQARNNPPAPTPAPAPAATQTAPPPVQAQQQQQPAPGNTNGNGQHQGFTPVSHPQTLEQIVAAQRAEDDRVKQITDIAAHAIQRRPMLVDDIDLMARAAIEKKSAVVEFELAVMRREREAPTGTSFAVHANGGSARLGPEALEAAICRSAGLRNADKHFSAPTLEAADRQFKHGVGLKEVLMLAARENGRSGISPNDVRGMLEGAFIRASSGFSTISLPGILSNAANKFVVDAFMAVEGSWRSIAATRPVSDFKAMSGYSLTGNLMLEKLGAGGEIKHGTLGELEYTNQADTFALMLAITRKDIINDDLGAFTRLPRMLGRGAATRINHDFWTTFLAGVGTFWTSGRGNLITGGDTVLSSASLKTATTAFKKQTDPDNNPLGAMPRILLVPTELEVAAEELMTAAAINTGGASTTDNIPNANVWRSKYQVVSSTYLSNDAITGESSTAWYLLADPNDIPTIEVAFLNGREQPIVESADADFNTLGVQFRCIHDFGVSLMEYRGSVRSAGA